MNTHFYPDNNTCGISLPDSESSKGALSTIHCINLHLGTIPHKWKVTGNTLLFRKEIVQHLLYVDQHRTSLCHSRWSLIIKEYLMVDPGMPLLMVFNERTYWGLAVVLERMVFLCQFPCLTAFNF